MAAIISADTSRSIRQSLHRLAQPLAVLVGQVDLLLIDMDETDPRLADVRLINEQLERVLDIVGEIRRLAREASPAEALPRYAPLDHAP